MISPPYPIIAKKLSKGELVPFLGAGASACVRPDETKFDPKGPTVLPSAWELSMTLADDCAFPSDKDEDRGDLAKVSSYYAHVSGDRSTLRARLRELIPASAVSGRDAISLHTLLARIEKLRVIVTTNYDTLIEEAFDAEKRPYDLIIYPAEKPEQNASNVVWCPHQGDPRLVETNRLAEFIDLAHTSVIFKMHGTRHPKDGDQDQFVITEEDYVEFLSRMTRQSAIPPVFIPHFRNRSFLFLGYGLKDWNLRVLLKNLPRQRDEELRSWAIQRAPSQLEQSLWVKRGVQIYDVDLNQFGHQLATAAGIPRNP